MRIGIDGACLANGRGFGRFARESLRALAALNRRHELVVFVDRPSLERVAVPAGCETIVVDVRQAPAKAASATGRRSLGDMLSFTAAAARARLDLLYFPATYSLFPVRRVPRVVTTMHDTLALAHPEWVFPTRAGRWAWRLKEEYAVRVSDRIVTVSEASRRDISAWFGLPADRLRVVIEGPDPVFRHMPSGRESVPILERYGIPVSRPFLLYVGGLSPHKNLSRLIEAFAGVRTTGAILVLVGSFGDVFHTCVEELRAKARNCGVEDRVRFTGFIPDDDLAHFYSRAEAVVLPSLMEGFGLPAVEAMACGTPVLYSRGGSLPEVIAEAGLSFDPTDKDAMTYVMRTLLERPALRAELADRALQRVGRYNWEVCARGLLDCFEELVPGRKGPAAAVSRRQPEVAVAGKPT